MSNSSDDIHRIKSLIASDDESNKSLGYSTLLHFQQHSAHNPSSIQSLAECSQSLICSIVTDVSDDDEEVAAQALKCLGFMIYHPLIVATLRVDDVNLVLESLAKLITTTKLKSACNLGAWCISVQQLGASCLANHFHSLILAIVHALDNPMGSLSTTFEAIQAVIKLAAQLSKKMRNLSHIWAPPIYRRLLSTDKRERDASERCLLKIRSTVIPPSLDLSKVIVKDMKRKLLIGTKNLLDQGMKIPAIQAWGWFVRMLGSHALKNRHLVNDMLKIPERTFTDIDYQVQIATQVAWEGLIDALIHCPIMASQKNTPSRENFHEEQHKLRHHNCDIEANGFSKSIKLIMTPLIGIMSSKCDISVQSSCLNTWCYLLHKLDTFVNEPLVIKIAIGPILEVIFQNGPDDKSIWLWNVGLDLLTDSVLQKCGDVSYQSTNQVRPRVSEVGPSLSGKCSWKQHSVKWLPWDISQLDFYLSMIFVLIRQASGIAVTCEHRSAVYEAALKLFISVLKGVQMDLTNPSVNYDCIMWCLNSLLSFMKKVCEDLYSDSSENCDLYYISIQFVDAISKELGPSILGSPLYKFALDLDFLDNLQSVDHVKHLNFQSVSCVSYMEKVSPLIYLTSLYFHLRIQLARQFPNSDCNSQGMYEYFKFLFSSADPLESLLTCVGLLYKHVQPIHLNIWIIVARGLKHSVDDAKCKSLQEVMSDSAGYSSLCHLLLYPLVVHSDIQNVGKYPILSERLPMLELIIQTWKSLYGFLSISEFRCSEATNFSEDICWLLIGFLDENASILESSTDINLTCKNMDLGLLYLSGNLMICILEQIQTSELIAGKIQCQSGGDSKISCGVENCLKFAARYMNLLRIMKVTDPPTGFIGTSRAASALACFVSCLHRKQDILLFLEIMTTPLLQWLSNKEMQDEGTNDQLQLMWTEILSCLRRSQPPINFGSAFLKLYEPLFEKTLDHPYPSISEPTINFWNSTFAQQYILDFPPSLLHVLDKLSRNGKLKLQKRSLPFLQKCHSHKEVHDALKGYKVTSKQSSTSKRVELLLDCRNHPEQKKAPLPLNLKRKRLELTEHQKEVKRAQQGRERDSGGHGPGIRTYTNLDFSQGHEDSQESQEDVRDSESILQMLRKAI
ncbi:Telomere-associated protein RIF1 [Senna tora]|uniref:Telomere-associated protein RIF1 n=1 Tax=Senna tora TaxID=362788 RepID=A0A834SZP9_9FABA|nr:Telomere-associated protein RIF1 [Senna tora]